MSEAAAVAGGTAWADALHIAAVLAVDPDGLGGVSLRSGPGPVRDAWLAALRSLLPEGVPVRRLPLNVDDDRLLGGLDLGVTLATGRAALQSGLLAAANGGLLLAAMAERLSAGTAARLAAALDQREIRLERDGFAKRLPASFALVALDEGIEPDERPPVALTDRLAFHVDLRSVRATDGAAATRADVAAARRRYPTVELGEDVLEALVTAALAMGVASARAGLTVVKAARALAALAGRSRVTAEDAAMAARLVLGSRATQLPAPAAEAEQGAEEEPEPPAPEPPGEQTEAGPTPPEPEPDRQEAERQGSEPAEADPEELAERVLAAAKAAIPPDLFAQLVDRGSGRAGDGGAGGRSGDARRAAPRGRAVGIFNGQPPPGLRPDLLATLRAAVPWQRLRAAELAEAERGERPLVLVRRQDLRSLRRVRPDPTTTIVAVDASGSAALARLNEAKGAVELLLAECYVRRDQVALLAFRGRSAEVLLPPTRALARAKRELAALPGGGGTPLAAGIDAAFELAIATRRKAGAPRLVFLTDGRGNVARDGTGGRAGAERDALASAGLVKQAGLPAVLLDTSALPHPGAAKLAAAMGARYVPLPQADAKRLAAAVAALARA